MTADELLAVLSALPRCPRSIAGIQIAARRAGVRGTYAQARRAVLELQDRGALIERRGGRPPRTWQLGRP